MPGRKFNLEGIRKFVGGDEEAVKNMIHVFLDAIPISLKKFNKAFQEKDYSQLAFYAHKIKSSIDILNIDDLKQDIRTIEHNAKTGTGLDQIPALHKKVNQVIQEVINELNKSEL